MRVARSPAHRACGDGQAGAQRALASTIFAAQDALDIWGDDDARFHARFCAADDNSARCAGHSVFPPPQPVYEAPIDRALANVDAMPGIEPAQRERLMGRLNLLAYARDDADFAYLQDSHDFIEGGAMPCTDVPQMGRGFDPDAPKPVFAPTDQCARLLFELGPRAEIPADAPAQPNAAAIARLESAEAHYARAIELDGDDLRARLGHAYTLDRLGRLDDARAELREIVQRGQPRLEPQADWELYTVLTETGVHFQRIATSATDRYRVRRLQKRLGQVVPMMYITPVVVPLRDAPFSALTNNASDVAFDFSGTGDTRAQGWLTPDAAWLVWDPNARGDVRSGFDMIGQRTWAVFWHDGFEVLRALDDDASGELNGDELTGLSTMARRQRRWRERCRRSASRRCAWRDRPQHTSPTRPPRPHRRPAWRALQDGSTRPLYDWTPGMEPVS